MCSSDMPPNITVYFLHTYRICQRAYYCMVLLQPIHYKHIKMFFSISKNLFVYIFYKIQTFIYGFVWTGSTEERALPLVQIPRQACSPVQSHLAAETIIIISLNLYSYVTKSLMWSTFICIYQNKPKIWFRARNCRTISGLNKTSELSER